MKKNGQYVGVDEKYIPEEEKYVDNEINGEIKDSINDGFRSVKNFVTDKDNQEKFKKTGKKGLKVLKGLGIGYLIFVGIVILLVVSIFVFSFVNIAKMNNRADDLHDSAGSIIDKVTDGINNNSNSSNNSNPGQTTDGYSKVEIKAFNAPFELYSGSQPGFFLGILLDKVVTNNKTEADHIITIIYNETLTSMPDEIITLKQNFEDSKQYEVSLDYNTDGFVNKITIK